MPAVAPVRDASGGAIVHATNAITGVTQTLTGVPVNSVLYAWVFFDVGTGDTAATPAVIDDHTLTWELIAERSKRSDGASAQNGHISVFRAKFLAGGAINVTASASGGSITATTPISVNTEVITGGRLLGGVPEIVTEGSSTGTVKLPSAGTTRAGRYSYVRGSNVDWNAAASPTPAAGWTTRVSARPGTPSPNYTAWGADLVAQAAASDIQFLSTAPTSGTINNSIMLEHLAAFTPLMNGAEDGVNAVAPVAATTGTAGNDPWDTVTATGGSAVVYSTDQAAHGTRSYKFTSTGTAGTALVQWNAASNGRLDRVFGRFYLRAAGFDPALTFLRLRGANTQVIRVGVDLTGHLQLFNSANTVIATTTAAIPANTWVRVDFDVTPSVAAGVAEVRLFTTMDSITPTETITVSAQAFGAAYVDEVTYGQTIAGANLPTFYLDDLQVNATGMPGPYSDGSPQTATLTGAASSSGYGSPTVLTDPPPINLAGFDSVSTVGAPAVAVGDAVVVPDGVPSGSAIGAPDITPDITNVTLAGVASAADVGQPAVSPGAVTVVPAGVASGSAVGQPVVAIPGVATVALTGVASAAAVGQPVVAGGTATVTLTGAVSGSGVGQPAVGAGAVAVALSGIGSGDGFGQPVLTVGLTISMTGLSSAGGVGAPAVTTLAVPTVALTGVARASVVGLPALEQEAVVWGIRAAAHRVTMRVP